jgi:DNA invertase Pin-like site-specific DNA recombinase
MSELELSILRQRSIEALKQEARRGELFMTVAVGYVKIRHDRIEKDPDQRVREAVALVFSKFAEFQSMRQVHLWFRHEHMWPHDRCALALGPRPQLDAVKTDGSSARTAASKPDL